MLFRRSVQFWVLNRINWTCFRFLKTPSGRTNRRSRLSSLVNMFTLPSSVEDRRFERGVKESIFVKLERPSLNGGGGPRLYLSCTASPPQNYTIKHKRRLLFVFVAAAKVFQGVGETLRNAECPSFQSGRKSLNWLLDLGLKRKAARNQPGDDPDFLSLLPPFHIHPISFFIIFTRPPLALRPRWRFGSRSSTRPPRDRCNSIFPIFLI